MAIRYRVTLTLEERDDLERFSKTGTKSARSVLLARALLLLDAGELGPHLPEQQVSQAVGLSCRPLEKTAFSQPLGAICAGIVVLPLVATAIGLLAWLCPSLGDFLFN